MRLLLIFASLALTAFANEGCGIEETQVMSFEQPQLSVFGRCPMLTQDLCLFVEEAFNTCPCICNLRRKGQNKDGVSKESSASGSRERSGSRSKSRKSGSKSGSWQKSGSWETSGTASAERRAKEAEEAARRQASSAERRALEAEAEAERARISAEQHRISAERHRISGERWAESNKGGSWETGSSGSHTGSSKSTYCPPGEFCSMCFASESTVVTDQGTLTMEELLQRPEARVLAWDAQTNEALLSPVRYWLHAEPNRPAVFRNLETDSASLLLTENHVIYRSSTCQQKDLEAVLAEEVAVDDCLLVRREGAMVLEKVKRATDEYKIGIYAPVTEAGSVIVDNVAASCYANHENTQLQNMLSKYTAFAFYFMRLVVPQAKNVDTVRVSSLYLALDQLKDYFL